MLHRETVLWRARIAEAAQRPQDALDQLSTLAAVEGRLSSQERGLLCAVCHALVRVRAKPARLRIIAGQGQDVGVAGCGVVRVG